MSWVMNLESPAAKRLVRVLKMHGDMDAADVGAKAGLSPSTVKAILRELHTSSMIHVSSWTRSEFNKPVKRYSWGKKEDAPSPKQVARAKRVTPTDPVFSPRPDVAAAWLFNRT